MLADRRSRRWPLAVLITAVVVAHASSSRGDDCAADGFFVRSELTGDATVTFDGHARTSDASSRFTFWSHDIQSWSPVGRGRDAVDFAFAFADREDFFARLSCARASYAAMAEGRPIPLRELCAAGPEDAGAAHPAASLTVRSGDEQLVFDASKLEGTVTATSTLDARGNGTVHLHVAVDEQTLTSVAKTSVNDGLPRPAGPPVEVRFRAAQLSGVAVFAPQKSSCPPSGGCDCGGPAPMWRPGGG